MDEEVVQTYLSKLRLRGSASPKIVCMLRVECEDIQNSSKQFKINIRYLHNMLSSVQLLLSQSLASSCIVQSVGTCI